MTDMDAYILLFELILFLVNYVLFFAVGVRSTVLKFLLMITTVILAIDLLYERAKQDGFKQQVQAHCDDDQGQLYHNGNRAVCVRDSRILLWIRPWGSHDRSH